MSKIVPVTTSVVGGEKAIGLVETNQKGLDGKAHRFQLIYVVRDGNTAEFRIDLGLTSMYKGTKLLNIPSLMEHTVDELIGLAQELRNETEIDVHELLQIDKMNLV
jgi:hypothetical protein